MQWYSDFSEGRGLRMERQVATIINHIDKQYAETMSEVSCQVCLCMIFLLTLDTIQESKVIRQGKGDQHIHL